MSSVLTLSANSTSTPDIFICLFFHHHQLKEAIPIINIILTTVGQVTIVTILSPQFDSCLLSLVNSNFNQPKSILSTGFSNPGIFPNKN